MIQKQKPFDDILTLRLTGRHQILNSHSQHEILCYYVCKIVTKLILGASELTGYMDEKIIFSLKTK